MEKKLQKERERLAKEMDARLETQRDKESKKVKLEYAKLEERKNELERDLLINKLREEKRRVDRQV